MRFGDGVETLQTARLYIAILITVLVLSEPYCLLPYRLKSGATQTKPAYAGYTKKGLTTRFGMIMSTVLVTKGAMRKLSFSQK